jgi:2-polyprenyl-3-methyl-5-hydroxy-6-metoxy-1,4-benzoquinol methylase
MTQHQPAAASPAYGDSAHYDEKYFAWQNQSIDLKAQRKVRTFQPYVKPDHTVLDFGSAGGGLIGGLRAQRRIGVEINDVARAAAEKKHPGVEYYKTLAGVGDGEVDVVVTNHTLEHLASPYDALLQIRPKLKPGGKLVIVVPIDDWRAQKQWVPGDINRHLFTWTPLNLGNLLDEAGYALRKQKIIRRTIMRGHDLYAKLPKPMFDFVRYTYSVIRHRQQLLMVAALKD